MAVTFSDFRMVRKNLSAIEGCSTKLGRMEGENRKDRRTEKRSLNAGVAVVCGKKED
jgi:hypothetical protein